MDSRAKDLKDVQVVLAQEGWAQSVVWHALKKGKYIYLF